MALPTIPEIETMNVSTARKQFSETLDRVHRGEARVVVEKSGIPVGAVVSMDDLEQLKRIDRNRTKLLEAMANIARHFEDVPEDELEREVEKAIAEVKAERRGRRESSSHLAS